MSNWNLAQIRNKVRQVTGRFSENEMSNNALDKYINDYYVFTFPAEVKLDKKHVYYEFMTEANQAYYTAPDTSYTNFEQLATVNNYNMLWYQNPNTYAQQNPLQISFLTPWTGDGVTLTFTYTVTGFPIFPGTLTITDNIELFEDTNNDWTTADVVLAGNAGGTATINYNDGTVSVTFNAAPANGQIIYLNYAIFKAGRPQAILYFESQFTLNPPPDQAYKIKMPAYQIVTALTDATDTPDLEEWGPTIAYGAARNIFADYAEMDSYAQTTALYKEQISYILTRTCENLLNTRSQPNF